MIKYVFFDLDGTLLPMEQEVFVKGYMSRLAKKLAPYGYKAEELVNGIWAGVASMVKNDGGRTNESAFWDTFAALLGEHVREHAPLFEDYYRNEFQEAAKLCGFNAAAAEVVKAYKNAGKTVALATNPIFPAIATYSRIRWAGLEPEWFRLITTYENSCHCKPNTQYYSDILNELDAGAEECIMIGNDVSEDMVAAEMGMKVFLVTDCLINSNNADISVYPSGSLEELLKRINKGDDEIM